MVVVLTVLCVTAGWGRILVLCEASLASGDLVDSSWTSDLSVVAEPAEEAVSGEGANPHQDRVMDTEIHCDQNDVNQHVIHLCAVMRRVLHTATTALTTETSTPTHSARSAVNFLESSLELFSRLVNSLTLPLLSASPAEQAVQRVLASMRALCVRLLRERVVQQPSLVQYGLYLLHSLINSDVDGKGGLGVGLWLVLYALPALEELVAACARTSRLTWSRAHREETVLLLLRMGVLLLQRVTSRRVVSLVSAVLTLALREVSGERSGVVSGDEEGMPVKLRHSIIHATLLCAQGLWSYRIEIGAMQWAALVTAPVSYPSPREDLDGGDNNCMETGFASWEAETVKLCVHTVLSRTPFGESNGDGCDVSSKDTCVDLVYRALPVAWQLNATTDPVVQSHLTGLESSTVGCRGASAEVSGLLLTLSAQAVDLCLQRRGRAEGVALLRAAGIDSERRCIDRGGRGSRASRLWRCVGSPHVHVSVRVMCMKILDVLATEVSLPSVSHTSIVPTPSEAEKAGSEREEGEEEEAALSLLQQVVGQEELTSFLEALQVMQASPQANPLRTSWCQCCCGAHHDHLLTAVDTDVSLEGPLLSETTHLTLHPSAHSAPCDSDHTSSDGHTHNDWLGIILHWLVILQRIDTHCTVTTVSSAHWGARAVIGAYLHSTQTLTALVQSLIRAQQSAPFSGVVGPAGGLPLPSCMSSFVIPSDDVYPPEMGVVSAVPGDMNLAEAGETCGVNEPVSDGVLYVEETAPAMRLLLAFSLHRSLCLLPILVRRVWSERCSRGESLALERFVGEGGVNEAIVHREMGLVEVAKRQGGGRLLTCAPPCQDPPGVGVDDGELLVAASTVSREVTATFVADEVTVELVIRLPPLYPLRNVEVEGRKRLGISEKRWRRWTLQIIQLLSHQDGSVLDAVLLWKRNVDKEFEGVEPCPICYSILHPKSLSMPSLACKTCNNKFHSACLYKWFNSSGKSKCVLCQQPFF